MGSVYYWRVAVSKQSAIETSSTDPARNERPNPATITTKERLVAALKLVKGRQAYATTDEPNHDGRVAAPV